MKYRDKYFPYPVIKNFCEDFSSTTFDIELNQYSVNNELIIEAKVLLDNEAIKNEIEKGNAQFVLHIEESETMFRQAYYSDETEFKINIPLDNVRRELEIISFIIVEKPIKDFYSNDLDLMYEGVNIEYDRNNIIGVGSANKIDIKKEDDDIEGVSSIFLVIPDENIKKSFQLVLNKNRVTIKVSNESFELYNKLAKSYSISSSDNNVILMSLMVLPAFVETLNILKKDHESYQDYIWFDSLVDAYEKKDINIIDEFSKVDFDAYKSSQIIFNDVIHNSLKRLDQIMLEES